MTALTGNWDREFTANAVTYIPGHSENIRDGGRTRNSAIPRFFDDWFHGDDRLSVPTRLVGTDSRPGALGQKSLAEFSRTFPNYRVRTAVEIGVDVTGRTVSDYQVRMRRPSNLAPITLEGEEGESNPFRTSRYRYDGGKGYLPAREKGPHTDAERFTVQDAGGSTVQGVRGSIIYGGSDTYLAIAKERGVPLKDLATDVSIHAAFADFWLNLPAFYTFLDFAVTADGAQAVRVWDASRYPAHALYVDGLRRDETVFREGEEWTRNGRFDAFVEFALESGLPGLTPFETLGSWGYDTFGAWGYKVLFRTGFGPHPSMRFVRGGSRVTAEALEKKLSSPLFP